MSETRDPLFQGNRGSLGVGDARDCGTANSTRRMVSAWSLKLTTGDLWTIAVSGRTIA
jgi:hypothetical protein